MPVTEGVDAAVAVPARHGCADPEHVGAGAAQRQVGERLVDQRRRRVVDHGGQSGGQARRRPVVGVGRAHVGEARGGHRLGHLGVGGGPKRAGAQRLEHLGHRSGPQVLPPGLHHGALDQVLRPAGMERVDRRQGVGHRLFDRARITGQEVAEQVVDGRHLGPADLGPVGHAQEATGSQGSGGRRQHRGPLVGVDRVHDTVDHHQVARSAAEADVDLGILVHGEVGQGGGVAQRTGGFGPRQRGIPPPHVGVGVHGGGDGRGEAPPASEVRHSVPAGGHRRRAGALVGAAAGRRRWLVAGQQGGQVQPGGGELGLEPAGVGPGGSGFGRGASRWVRPCPSGSHRPSVPPAESR
jgi:hypothetical protein